MQMQYSWLVASIVLTFTACNKTGSDEADTDGSLKGTWELHQTFGGMSPGKTYARGNGSLLKFDDNNYTMVRGGQILLQGTYKLAVDSFVDVNTCAKQPPKSSNPNWIIADSSGGLKTYFDISNGLLKLTSGCIPADGGGSVYKRVAETK